MVVATVVALTVEVVDAVVVVEFVDSSAPAELNVVGATVVVLLDDEVPFWRLLAGKFMLESCEPPFVPPDFVPANSAAGMPALLVEPLVELELVFPVLGESCCRPCCCCFIFIAGDNWREFVAI